jgi:hypothetical protein
MVGQDWDTTAGLWSDKTGTWVMTAGIWPDKTGTRLPAYGRTRLLAYGQTRLPDKTICRTICRTRAGLDCRLGIAYQCDVTQIDANIDATQIDVNFNELTRLNFTWHTTTRRATVTKFAINYSTCIHDEIRNNWVNHPPPQQQQQQQQQQKAECRPARALHALAGKK